MKLVCKSRMLLLQSKLMHFSVENLCPSQYLILLEIGKKLYSTKLVTSNPASITLSNTDLKKLYANIADSTKIRKINFLVTSTMKPSVNTSNKVENTVVEDSHLKAPLPDSMA